MDASRLDRLCCWIEEYAEGLARAAETADVDAQRVP